MINSKMHAIAIDSTQLPTTYWCKFEVVSIFSVSIAKSIDKCLLTIEKDGIRYVSRRTDNNGLEVKAQIHDLSLVNSANAVSLTMVGSYKGTAFWQGKDFFASQNILLFRNEAIDEDVGLFLATVLTKKYRTIGEYHAIKKEIVLKDSIELPAIECEENYVPDWDYMRTYMNSLKHLARYGDLHQTLLNLAKVSELELDNKTWHKFRLFKLSEGDTGLFEIVSGNGSLIKDAKDSGGDIPLISSTEKSNGVAAYVNGTPDHSGNVLTLAVNGSVGECFFQPKPFCFTTDVRVLKPTFPFNKNIALALATIIRIYGKQKYSYGRKWTITRMKEDYISLPANSNNEPDFEFLESYIANLNSSLSKRVENSG